MYFFTPTLIQALIPQRLDNLKTFEMIPLFLVL